MQRRPQGLGRNRSSPTGVGAEGDARKFGRAAQEAPPLRLRCGRQARLEEAAYHAPREAALKLPSAGRSRLHAELAGSFAGRSQQSGLPDAGGALYQHNAAFSSPGRFHAPGELNQLGLSLEQEMGWAASHGTPGAAPAESA